MLIPIADAHNRLSQIIKRLDKGPVTITSHGKPVGVIIAPAEYAQLQQVQAYLQLIRLSESLQNSGVTAQELFEASRQELERLS
jgi:prevent-host-death family protein